MIKKLKNLLNLLSQKQQKKFIFLQILVLITAVFELIGIASIGPFMILVSDFSVLEGDNIIAKFYLETRLNNHFEFAILIGMIVLMLLLIGSIISMYTTWLLAIFGQEIGVKLGSRLFQFYLHRTWLFHTTSSSSNLTKKITVEVNRITNGVITPFMQLNSKIVTSFFISIALLIYNPLVTLVALIIFSFSYFMIFRLVRYRLSNNGDMVSAAAKERFKLMAEGFGGVRDILLSRSQKHYIDKFEKSGNSYAHYQGETLALAHVPRYIMELVAFGSLILFLLYLIIKYDGKFDEVLPILSVYTLASFKLIPALQHIYACTVLIRGHISSFSLIEKDLKQSLSFLKIPISNKRKKIKIKGSIKLNCIKFTYPKKNIATIKDINIKIPVNKVIGLAGESGSGKSTIIDILVGLIQPSKGEILIDENPLSIGDIPSWQDEIGFVSQSIFLSDATILENVAFTIPKEKINKRKVRRSIRLAGLEKVIDELPDGIETVVGERGVQLSGGQRQRVGIARALYNDPKILVFDEATSALDSNTEKVIMDSIFNFSGLKTIIIIAHRLSTLKKCDLIYFIDKGKVSDKGSFQTLLNNNIKFKKMANLIT